MDADDMAGWEYLPDDMAEELDIRKGVEMAIGEAAEIVIEAHLQDTIGGEGGFIP